MLFPQLEEKLQALKQALNTATSVSVTRILTRLGPSPESPISSAPEHSTENTGKNIDFRSRLAYKRLVSNLCDGYISSLGRKPSLIFVREYPDLTLDASFLRRGPFLSASVGPVI